MADQSCISMPLQPQRARPRPNRPLPLDEYENYCDVPPDDLELEEVEFIWWALASRMSKKELKKKFNSIVASYSHSGCFQYAAVADGKGRGRYPRGVINTLYQALKGAKLMGKHPETGILYIQVDVWHLYIQAAFEWCPPEALTKRLRGLKIEYDLGL
ncbi:hypothetical protein [Pseudomonas putida]|mgnify:CR=1 FL=1|uniref:Uncharacterized protein n=1 Tax=Pseudomonas putida TaxID=303 RepID=A0A7V8J2Y3_PSEPU|nr:hypothetical protein [Pseudomonas putida]EKT4460509.1 hypothetical protein [Pseudomonas putida]KAF0252871.1 hypothetical protein GN299_20770 [Pseudomonas putida]